MTSHPLTIEMLEEGHTLLLGQTRSGKTYQLRGILERLRRADRRVGSIDKLGQHWGLTLSPDGQAPGLDFVIFGGKRAHVPMAPGDGARLGRLFVERNIPAIFDVSQWHDDDQQRWVADFADAVFLHNEGALHLVLDEAPSWIPQDQERGEAFKPVRRLTTQGLGNGIRIIMAAQGWGQIDKTSARMASLVVTMRQFGADFAAMRKFLPVSVSELKPVEQELPALPPGTGYVWDPVPGTLSRYAFPANTTFDSSRTPRHGDTPPAPIAVSGALVEELRALLNPPIAKTEPERSPSGSSDPPDEVTRLKAIVAAQGVELEQLRGADAVCNVVHTGMVRIDDMLDDLHNLIGTIRRDADAILHRQSSTPTSTPVRDRTSEPVAEDAPAGGNRARREPAGASSIADAGLPQMSRRLIEVLARFYPRAIPIEHAAQIGKVGIKSSQWPHHFREFQASGLVEQMANGNWRISPVAAQQLGLLEVPDAAGRLVDFWVAAFQPAIGRMLRALVNARGEWLSRAELCDRAQVSPTSSTVGAGIKDLRDHDLIEIQSGEIRAAAILLQDRS